jgi:hypothetical protein
VSRQNRILEKGGMMKRKLVTVLAVLLLLSSVFGVAFAQVEGVQTLPGGGWVTGTQVQNVGTGNALIMMRVYGQASGEWDQTYTDVLPGSSVNFAATSFGWPDGSIGSAVVESDEPIAAVTNETNGTAAAQYQGIGSPDTEINFPLVKNNYKGSGKYTTFFVQNASSTPAIIYATYTSEDGTTYPWDSTVAIDGYRMVMLNPTDVGFPTTQLGSLHVYASVPLAGVVNEHHVSDTIILQATRGFAPADAGTTLLIPTIKYLFGNRITGPIIQNVSGGSVNITITYKGTGIDFVQHADNVPDGASVTFFKNTEVCPAGATCYRTGTALPAGTLASAVVESTGNIVGVTNESFDTIPAGQRQRVTTTSAFNADQATTKVAVPLYKVNHDYKNTGVQLQNGDTANAASYTATFSLGGSLGTPVTEYVLTGTIDAGKYVTLFKLYAGLPAGSSWVGSGFPAAWSTSSTSGTRFGSVVITSDKPIVAAVTESDDDPVVGNRQDIKSFEAFNLTP